MLDRATPSSASLRPGSAGGTWCAPSADAGCITAALSVFLVEGTTRIHLGLSVLSKQWLLPNSCLTADRSTNRDIDRRKHYEKAQGLTHGHPAEQRSHHPPRTMGVIR